MELERPLQEDAPLSREQRQYAIQIVLDSCAAVRGILNDNHGGPLTPPGWRMANALETICQSLERNLSQPSTPISSPLKRLHNCIQRGLALYNQDKALISEYVEDIKQVFDTLNPEQGAVAERRTQFRQFATQFAKTADPVKVDMSEIMQRFEVGLFVGSDDCELPGDNLDLERWIKKPKGHERRIHGRQHAGIRLVIEGPTLLSALDAHLSRTTPLAYQELLPYVEAEIPESQVNAQERHRIMTKASSKKNESPC